MVAIAVVLAFLASVVFAGTSGMPYLQAPPAERTSGDGDQKARSEGESSAVDIKSDLGRQTDHNGSKIYIVVGNVAAHHNGAVITCDSAVRYSERRLECFGNVLINKGTTYIYGERAEYNGDLNEAYVYSRIVKVVDRSVAEKLRYLDPVAVTNRYSGLLKEKGCDLVIVLSHLGMEKSDFTDIQLARSCRNVDLIIGGHSHTFLEEPVCVEDADGNDVMIVTDGCWGLYVGKLEL